MKSSIAKTHKVQEMASEYRFDYKKAKPVKKSKPVKKKKRRYR